MNVNFASPSCDLNELKKLPGLKPTCNLGIASIRKSTKSLAVKSCINSGCSIVASLRKMILCHYQVLGHDKLIKTKVGCFERHGSVNAKAQLPRSKQLGTRKVGSQIKRKRPGWNSELDDRTKLFFPDWVVFPELPVVLKWTEVGASRVPRSQLFWTRKVPPRHNGHDVQNVRQFNRYLLSRQQTFVVIS